MGGCVALAVCDAAIHRRQQPAVVSGSRSKKKKGVWNGENAECEKGSKEAEMVGATRKCKRGKKKKWDSISKREKKNILN